MMQPVFESMQPRDMSERKNVMACSKSGKGFEVSVHLSPAYIRDRVVTSAVQMQPVAEHSTPSSERGSDVAAGADSDLPGSPGGSFDGLHPPSLLPPYPANADVLPPTPMMLVEQTYLRKVVVCVCRDMRGHNALVRKRDQAERSRASADSFMRLINHESAHKST